MSEYGLEVYNEFGYKTMDMTKSLTRVIATHKGMDKHLGCHRFYDVHDDPLAYCTNGPDSDGLWIEFDLEQLVGVGGAALHSGLDQTIARDQYPQGHADYMWPVDWDKIWWQVLPTEADKFGPSCNALYGDRIVRCYAQYHAHWRSDYDITFWYQL